MRLPHTPADEPLRLKALRGLGILDSAPTDSLDGLTALAAKLLNAPIALISLVDANRQWFKACVGLDARETPREISFCGHAVFERQALVVPDATLDERFAGVSERLQDSGAARAGLQRKRHGCFGDCGDDQPGAGYEVLAG